jgi:hypothetical protein
MFLLWWRRKGGQHPRPRKPVRSQPDRARADYRPGVEALERRLVLDGTLSLAPNLPAPQLVGQPIVWTATSTGFGDSPVYQFSVGPSSGPLRVVRDFSTDNTFAWAPMQEGTYQVKAIVKEGFSATQSTSAVVADAVNSRVTGPGAVVTPTDNPLVALYSAPPGPAGTTRVLFRPASAGPKAPWTSTDPRPSVAGLSTNILVAGMLANTTYELVAVTNGAPAAPLLFTTWAPPAGLPFPAFTVAQPPGPGSDLGQNTVLHMVISGSPPTINILATDLMGNVDWYYNPATGLGSDFATSLVPGGTLLLLDTPAAEGFSDFDELREIDLAGNTLRETNLDAINAQLAALGRPAIIGLHHDAQRLPNGSTAVLAQLKKTIDVNGTPTEYLGDMVLVLDQDFQVKWTWNAFDFLDTKRVLESPSDWTHSNAVSWTPDGNLLISIRHQDWVIKIAYANGTGDGHVIWRLGKDGDFSIQSSDPWPWFSHQHDAHYVDATTLVVFDNGNTRIQSDPNGHSRGQVLSLNEQTHQATLVLNADLGNYSGALGSAQKLPGGNYVFTSGLQGWPQLPIFGQSIEVLPSGSTSSVLEVEAPEYRSYRMSGLYGQPLTSIADTSTTLTSPANPSGFNQPVALTATVASAGGTPTGTVTFREGDAVLGTAALNANGVATLTTLLPLGHHTLTATYDGNVLFGPSVAPPLSQTVGTANERYVDLLYLDELGRHADPAGLAYWVGFLNQGRPRGVVAQAIATSPERSALIVQGLYSQSLHRSAEPAALGQWVAFLSAGGTVTSLQAMIAGSPEYLQARGGGTTDGFVSALFQDALGRPVDPPARAYFTQVISGGLASRGQVAQMVFTSPEGRQDQVRDWYQQYLGRPADAGGLAYFAAALENGARDESVVAALLASDEFFAKV